MKTHSLIFKTIALIIAITFTTTTVWSASDFFLRQQSAVERDVKLEGQKSPLQSPLLFISGRKGEAGMLDLSGIRDWFRERKCMRLAKKVGLKKGTEEFNLAVKLGMKLYEKGRGWELYRYESYSHYEGGIFPNAIPYIINVAKTPEEPNSSLFQLGFLLFHRQL